jgi:hypothetical protein
MGLPLAVVVLAVAVAAEIWRSVQQVHLTQVAVEVVLVHTLAATVVLE